MRDGRGKPKWGILQISNRKCLDGSLATNPKYKTISPPYLWSSSINPQDLPTQRYFCVLLFWWLSGSMNDGMDMVGYWLEVYSLSHNFMLFQNVSILPQSKLDHNMWNNKTDLSISQHKMKNTREKLNKKQTKQGKEKQDFQISKEQQNIIGATFGPRTGVWRLLL